MEEELRSHVVSRADDLERQGLTRAEAERQARVEFGGYERYKEECRDALGLRLLGELAADVRYGLRQLRQSPGFTAVAVLTLALGIGANTAIFSIVDATLLERLPYPQPEQIVMVWEKLPKGGRNVISTMNFLDWKRQSTVFSAIAAERDGSMTLTGGDRPVQLQGARESASSFDVWGVKPLLGRAFAPDEDQPGKNLVVVLSHRLWESRFGADPKILGRTLNLNGKPYAVIGVMPPGVFDRIKDMFWVPLAFEPQEMTRDYRWMICFAKLKPGVTLQQARDQMKLIAARIEHDHPESNKGWSATVDRFRDIFVDDSLRRSLWVLLAAVGAVLMIGCVNLANVLLARGTARQREVVLRSALGASKGRLVRQFLTESALLSGCGGVAGLLTGYGLMKMFKIWTPYLHLPVEADVQLDGRVLVFTAIVVIVTGILFGIAPAIHTARHDLVNSLKEGGGTATSSTRRKRVRNALVVAEIAAAFVLLCGAALLIRSLYRLQQVDPGFESTNVITMRMPMTSAEYPDGPRIVSYLDVVRDKLDALPGVLAAATTSALPFEGWSDGMGFRIEGRPFVDMANRPDAGFKQVSPSYLSALRMRLREGRWLAESDTAGSVPVMVINEPMATRYFKGEDPIGKRILVRQIVPGQPALGPEIAWQVVGVVAEEKVDGLDDSSPGMYVSYKQSPTTGTALVVRAAMNPGRLLKTIEAAIWQLNKNQALDDIKPLEQIEAESLGPNRLRTVLLGIFAAVAVLLATIGIYGVISYSVAQRTHEMGVRAALGASRWDQLRLVLEGGMVLTALGLGIGVIGALALTRLLASLLFGVSPHDLWSLAAAAVILTAVAAVACYLPARRATNVDPMVALRHE
jgi:putative ABC transport system permease protein